MTPPSPAASAGSTHAADQTAARIVGALFLVTFITSIGAVFLYAPVLHPAKFLAGTGSDGRIRLGAALELILIVANIGTAVLLFPVLRRRHEALALGFVASRLIESAFIAVGLLSLLAVVTLRHDGTADAGSLAAAKSLVTVRNWTFILGPGFVVGIGNGMILGYIMYRARLVPRAMAWLGLVGGPLVSLTGIAIVMDVIGKGSAVQGVATVPEFCWELSLGVYLLVRGFRTAAPVANEPQPGFAPVPAVG